MKTLIIGANGNLGNEIVNQLATKTQVKATVRKQGDFLVMLYNIAGEGHMAHQSEDVQKVLARAPRTFNDIV